MDSGWLKAKLVATKTDIDRPKMLRDSGVPNDTEVIAIVPSYTFPTNLNSDWVWQGCVGSAVLVGVDLVRPNDLPALPSPILESSGHSLTSNLTLYVSNLFCRQHCFKPREVVWLQPMESFPVQEVWLSPSQSNCEEHLIQHFLEQIYVRTAINKVLVRMDSTLQFVLNSSHDQASSNDSCGSPGPKELWFDVLTVLPVAQGHVTMETKIVIIPPVGYHPSQLHNSDESESDESSGVAYHVQAAQIMTDNESDDTEDEDSYLGSHDLPSLLQAPRRQLISASDIRRSSLDRAGNAPHIFTCLPLYDFPAEKNFIILHAVALKQLGCYGLENLLIAPVDSCQPTGYHGSQGIRFVAIVEEMKGKLLHGNYEKSRSVAYVHPELYFNLFPFPVDHMTTTLLISAEVYRAGLCDVNEPFVKYKEIVISPVYSPSFYRCKIPMDVLLRRHVRRENEMFLAIGYVFSISTDYGVIHFKIVSTEPSAELGSVGMFTSVHYKTPGNCSFVPDCEYLTATCPPYWLEHCPGGLYDYYQQLLSLCLPVYQRSRSHHQSCVLITGPSGVGKNIVAKAVARACRIHLISVNCYDLGDHVPNILKRMNIAIEDAESCAPSLLLFRKLHALCKERDGLPEDPRIAQMFEKLVKRHTQHNVSSNYPVLIIGTTSRPDILPHRISGCFIHDVVMTTPNQQERLLMMQGLSGTMTTTPDVDFVDLSLKSSGLLLGDFVAMTTHASQLATQEAIQHCFPSGKMTRSCDQLSLSIAGVTVSQSHYDRALKHIQECHSDAIGAPKVPTVSWKDVGGLEVAKQEILDTIQLPLQHPEMFAKGLRRSGVLLYGAPGTGKTLIAKAVATECALNFLSVKGPELMNMYVGQSEQNIREVFARAKSATPCVIFFDEIDSLAPNRGRSGDSGGVMDRIVSQLLAELDGLQANKDIFVIGATNRPDLIDPSLLRPGRFDRLVYLDVTDDVISKLSVLKALTRGLHLHEDVSLQDIAKRCPSNTTGADLYALCNEATRVSLRRTINSLQDNGSSDDDWTPPLVVTNDDFLVALADFKPSVSETELENYRDLQKRIVRN